MSAARTSRRVIVEADGGSRGNPGIAGYGAVVRDPAGDVLATRSEHIGRTTNNVAEYRALIAGLSAAAELGATDVEVRMDSKLVVEQMSGHWKVKNAELQTLYSAARHIVEGFAAVRFGWVPRARNAAADRLANAAMDAAPERRSAGGPAAAPSGQLAFDSEPGVSTRMLLLAAAEPGPTTAAGAAGPGLVVSAPGALPQRAARALADYAGVELRTDPDLDTRPSRALARISAAHPGDIVAVVADTAVVALAVRLALDVPPTAAARLQLAPGSLSVLDWSPSGPVAVRSIGSADQVPDG